MSMGDIAVRHCKEHGRYTYDMYNGTKEDKICPKCREELVKQASTNRSIALDSVYK